MCLSLYNSSINPVYMISCHLLYQVNDASLVKLAGSCFRLRYVSLGLCSQVKDSTLIKLGTNCPDLKFLNLYKCINLSEHGLERLLSSSNKLEFLDIRDIRDVTRTFVNRMKKQYRYVEIKFSLKSRQPRMRWINDCEQELIF